MKGKESRAELKAKELIKEIDLWRDIISKIAARYNEKISTKLKKQSDELSSCKKRLERGLEAKKSRKDLRPCSRRTPIALRAVYCT